MVIAGYTDVVWRTCTASISAVSSRAASAARSSAVRVTAPGARPPGRPGRSGTAWLGLTGLPGAAREIQVGKVVELGEQPPQPVGAELLLDLGVNGLATR